jgi:RNA polymerase sigma-70 factor (ECF subfamily)
MEQEREYIQQAQTDPRAFGHLYDHYFPRVHAYVRYRVYDSQDAQDVISEVFLKAVQNLKRFKWRHNNSFAAWLFRIAHNQVRDYYRQRRRAAYSLESQVRLAGLAAEMPLPEESIVKQETFGQVRARIAALSPRRQEIVTLKFYAGLRNFEIAQILGLTERTVAAHLFRALQDLKQRYAVPTQSERVAEASI